MSLDFADGEVGNATRSGAPVQCGTEETVVASAKVPVRLFADVDVANIRLPEPPVSAHLVDT